MKIDMMRRIDRRLGIPLCFLLTCWNKIRQIFSRKKNRSHPRDILFIELSEMGSMVLAYSLFKKTRDLFPDAALHFLTFTENRYAADCLDFFPPGNIHTIPSKSPGAFFSGTIKTLARLRRIRPDVSIDLELFSRGSMLLSFLSGARSRVGFYRFFQEGLYRGRLLSHEVEFNPQIHMAQNLLNLVYALKAPAGEIPKGKHSLTPGDIAIPRFRPEKQDRNLFRDRLLRKNRELQAAGKIILINPNASELIPIRRWPRDHYIQLAKMILERPDTFILITGASSEAEEAEWIQRKVESERCENLAGQTSFPELLTLYTLADILITNDSGPAHFSSMTDIKTFVFFGPETPRLYGPLSKSAHVFYSNYSCSPCVSAFNHRKSPCRDNLCLRSITPESVFTVISQHLQ